MEADTELEKKTTILFSSQEHAYYSRVARDKGVSLGQLVRDALRTRHGAARSTTEQRLAAAKALGEMSLPVSDVATMKRESIPSPDDLLP